MSNRRGQPTTDDGFDFRARVDELRCTSTPALRRLVADARREQARWYLEELAATRVLDDRSADAVPDATISARTAKSNRDTARSLEELPEIAQAVWDGSLTKDQLLPVAQVATPATDAEWSVRGSRMTPVDLQRMARSARRVTAADAEARRQARYLTTWRDAEQGMVFGRWALPDVDGVLVEKVLDGLAERMRPVKGQPWNSLAHRKADALVMLCRDSTGGPGPKRPKPVVVVHTNAGTPGGEVDGIPIAEETVEELRLDARVVVQDDAAPVTDLGAGRIAIPVAVERELERRDPHCRYPGCERTRGLQRHHLDPVAWGGRTSRKQLALLCPEHHHRMEPHGTERLIGDPDLPDGLTVKDTRAGPDP